MQWCSLHTHTGWGSYKDGFGTVPAHVSRIAELGMSAAGISEHGNVNTHAAWERECRNAGIKPVFGIEIYLSPMERTEANRHKTHMGLYAMNEEGYRNLNLIVTQSWKDFYQFPTVSWKSLVKYNAGILALSGCADSLISCSLLGGKFLGERRESYSERDLRTTIRRVRQFRDIFGERYYLEVQRFPDLPRTCQLNPVIASIAASERISLVATADVHYPYPNQNEMQRALHATNRGSTTALLDAEWEYGIILSYPESDEEIWKDLVATGLSADDASAAIEATVYLATQCTVELPKAKPLRFPGVAKQPNHESDWRGSARANAAKRYMWEMLRAGWEYRCSQRPEIAIKAWEYNARLQREMKVIGNKELYDYFLVISDLVTRAKNRGTVIGPARGSAASSLVCYLLRITEIDPLHPVFNRMEFSRFIDPTRTDYPDIDLDFDDEKRWETVKDAVEIYGVDNVANVGNNMKYRGKQALNAMARAHGLPTKAFKPIKDRITDRTETDERVDDSIEDAIEAYKFHPQVAELLVRHPDPIRLAAMLEGDVSGPSTHAAGFVIADDPIPDVCPIYTRESGSGRNLKTVSVIPYDKRDAEYLGMLKMDFLGLNHMGMIGKVLDWTGMTMENLYKLPFDDSNAKGHFTFAQIMKRFVADDVTGIFQFEGVTTRNILKRVNPTEFRHLADINALSRPGPKYGGQTENYIAVKNGEMDWERIGKGFDEHVEWTYGQIVYQEQIMWILRDLAGFDVPTVLKVRKIIGKKLGEHQFAALWEQFRDGCLSNGVGEHDAVRVWSAITTAAGYAFNTSHAYSYSVIAWWEMWLKIHYPTEFFAASLAKNGDGKDNIARRTALCQDAQAHGQTIKNLNLDISQSNWSIFEKEIYPGFQQVPGIAELTATDIVDYLDNLNISDFGVPVEALTQVNGVGGVTMNNVRRFIANPDPLGINVTRHQLERFRVQLANGEFDGSGLPENVEIYYDSDELPLESNAVAWVGMVSNIDYRDEVETQHRKTGKSHEQIMTELGRPENTKKCVLFAYDEDGEVALRTTIKNHTLFEETIQQIKPGHSIVVVYGRTWRLLQDSIFINGLWVLEPE